MASINANGSRGHHKFTLNVNETGVNTGNNTSTVSWSFVLSPIQTGWDWNVSGISYSINVDGNVKNGTIQSYNGSSTVTLASGTKTITHNNDGSKSISFSFSVSDRANKTYTPGNASKSGSLTLTKINRYPTLTSGSNFTDEGNPTLKFSNAGVYPVRVKLEAGGNTQLIIRDIPQKSTSYTFDLTEQERNTLRALTPNSNSLSVTQTVCAMNGNTELSASYKNYTMTIVNANPIFEEFTYEDSNLDVVAITGNSQVFVKGLSTPKITITSQNKMETLKYATPVKYTATIDNLNGNVNYSDDDNVVINLTPITSVGTKRLSVRAYDSRNNSTEIYQDVEVYDYVIPTINATAVREGNFENETTLSISGTYTPLTINNVNKNIVTQIQYRIREKNGEWGLWNNVAFTTNDGNYSATDVVVSLDNTKEFEIEFKVVDNLQQASTIKNVDIGIPLFMISTNLKNIYVQGNPVVEAGGNNNDYYIKYYDGTMICYGKKEIATAITHPWGNIYTSFIFDPQINFPEEFTNIFSCNVSGCNTGNVSLWIGDLSFTTTGINGIQFFRGTAQTDSSRIYTITYSAFGRWK